MIKLNIEIESLKDIDSTEQDRIRKIIRKIPSNIAQGFIEREYVIKLKPKKDMEAGTAGEYSWLNRTISLKYKFEPYMLYHEIGHFVDMDSIYSATGHFSDTQVFTRIYVEEKYYMNQFIKPHTSLYRHCTEDIREYFAQSFAHYILNSDKLKELAPYTHEYIARCIKAFK